MGNATKMSQGNHERSHLHSDAMANAKKREMT